MKRTYTGTWTKMKYTKIEQHLYEGKNHKVRIEYYCYINAFTYDIKERKPKGIEKEGMIQIFHF